MIGLFVTYCVCLGTPVALGLVRVIREERKNR